MSRGLYAQDGEDLFPKLASYYTRCEVRDIDVSTFSHWDLMILPRRIDNYSNYKRNMEAIKELNPDERLLLYCQSTSAHNNLDPPDPIKVAADEYGWWLKSYEGEYLYYEGWEFLKLLNMTNTESASGSHPTGMKANEFIPQLLISDHIAVNSYWSGIFYDTFSNNLGWMYHDIKDGTTDGIPEFEDQHNGDQPIFSSLWNSGMVSLASKTRELGGDIIIVGNGGNTGSLAYINGKLREDYNRNYNLSDLANLYNYLARAEVEPRIGIVNGVNKDADPSDFLAMRFALGSALLLGAHLAFDFGSRYHAEYLWFDEYNVLPSGDVAAVSTTMREDIGIEDDNIPVQSTSEFRSSGLIYLDGELVCYASKDDTTFLECYRGYPKVNPNYDLRAPHQKDAEVVQYDPEFKGYLGKPVSEAFDVQETETKLGDLLLEAGWFAGEEDAENINSRVWRRDFENGTVIVNPTSSSQTVGGLGDGQYLKIKGIQDPVHNDGSPVSNQLVIGSKDCYILLKPEGSNIDEDPPTPPEGLSIIE